MDETKRIYDIVVFGATGFTGRCISEYLARHLSSPNIRFAIAGRNFDKLMHLRTWLQAIQSRQSEIGVIVANIQDPSSLVKMAEQTQVMLSAIGPYSLYGEPTIQACLQTNTHYLDLSAEPEFVDNVYVHFNQLAVEKNLCIMNSCGFESVPADLGVLFAVKTLQKKFDETVTGKLAVKVEAFVQVEGKLSSGTWQSLITAFSRVIPYARQKRLWRRNNQSAQQAMQYSVEAVSPKLRFHKDIGYWSIPLPLIDAYTVKRSAYLRGDYGAYFKYGHNFCSKSLVHLVKKLGILVSIFTLSQVSMTRDWLRHFVPMVEGPTDKERQQGWFEIILKAHARGQSVKVRVKGSDPGYSETAKFAGEAALCLVMDKNDLLPYRGVVTPSALMGESLLRRLQQQGVIFEEIIDAEVKL